jgi:geranylgeranyl transferase type-2 subunit beta
MLGKLETQQYLSDLTAQLAAGLKFLPDSFRSRHSEFLLAAQRPDGGFTGRQGGSDIYYTMFALRSVELISLTDEGLWRGAAQYNRSLSAPPRDMIECFCLLYLRRLAGRLDEPCEGSCKPSQRRDARRAGIMEVVERSRAANGGYARFPGGEATVYHTFLAALCAELSDSNFSAARSPAEAGEAAAFVRSRRCADGGYADSGNEGGAGATNPTAAALALLAISGDLNGDAAAQAAGFLASMQRPEGGFAACAGAPEPDLLSTFTATVALSGIGALGRVKLAPAARFAHALQAVGGGFRGCAGDDAPDVEYTYYGLGTLAILAGAAGG